MAGAVLGGEGILCAGLVFTLGVGLPYYTSVISLLFFFHCWF